MKQYCRYCAYAVQPMEGDVWCDELNKMMLEQSAKTVNHCKHFVFNEIDVFDLDKKYKPRAEKPVDNSPTLFD